MRFRFLPRTAVDQKAFANGRSAALMLCVLLAGPAAPNVPNPPGFPPPAAVQATSVQAALAALGIARAEYSTYVMLDAPEIAAPGKITVRIGSELPGTSMLVLLRNLPEAAAPRPPATTKAPRRPPPAAQGNPPAAPTALPVPMPSLVVARKFEPGEPPELSVDVDITGPQRYAVFAFAQGRWFATEREVKVGRDASHR